MSESRSLGDDCRSVGLDFRCEHRHSEPRYRLTIDQQIEPPRLSISIRNDDSIVPRAIHADPSIPAVLFAVVEETVCREPVMNIWLPTTEVHRYVAWREGDAWMARKLGEVAQVSTAGEAVAWIRDQDGEGAAAV